MSITDKHVLYIHICKFFSWKIIGYKARFDDAFRKECAYCYKSLMMEREDLFKTLLFQNPKHIILYNGLYSLWYELEPRALEVGIVNKRLNMDVFSEYVMFYSFKRPNFTVQNAENHQSCRYLTENCNGVIYLDISTEMCEIGPTF